VTIIIRNKKDIAAYIASCPVVLESKRAYEEDDPGSFAEVEAELVKLIASESVPDFGEDWEEWLSDNIEELLQEAISIVM
jgi:hypothetical protein